MKIKNISKQRLIEPYFNIVLEPEETIELEGDKLTRFLIVFGPFVKIVDKEEEFSDEKTEEDKKSKRGRKPKNQEELNENQLNE
jgi:hypothetical protein